MLVSGKVPSLTRRAGASRGLIPHRDFPKRMDRTDWPTAGPNQPVPVWDEYRQLREAVHDYTSVPETPSREIHYRPNVRAH